MSTKCHCRFLNELNYLAETNSLLRPKSFRKKKRNILFLYFNLTLWLGLMKISAETVGVIFYQSTFHLVLPRRHRDIVSLNTIPTKQEKQFFQLEVARQSLKKQFKSRWLPIEIRTLQCKSANRVFCYFFYPVFFQW